jgi:hypothetical protein
MPPLTATVRLAVLLRANARLGGRLYYSATFYMYSRLRKSIRMQTATAWIIGIAMAALVLLGIVIASRAADPYMYYIGLGFCLFGVLFNYGMISRNSGH